MYATYPEVTTTLPVLYFFFIEYLLAAYLTPRLSRVNAKLASKPVLLALEDVTSSHFERGLMFNHWFRRLRRRNGNCNSDACR